MPPDENDGQAVTTLAQAALLRATRSIRPRTGRGDAVPPGDEGGRKPRWWSISGRSAVRGAAAIRQSNTASGGESRYSCWSFSLSMWESRREQSQSQRKSRLRILRFSEMCNKERPTSLFVQNLDP